MEGAGPVLLTEEPYLSQAEREAHMRLACQVKVKGAMKLLIPEELFNIREFVCDLEEIEDMTYDIKRLRRKLPPGRFVTTTS